MYGIRYANGEVDNLSYDLRFLMEDYLWSIDSSRRGSVVFDGATPVVQVGTNPDDLQWETFSDAHVEIPDAWFEWLSQP